MDRLMGMVEIRNRPGLFAVVDPAVKQRIEQGSMKLYMSSRGVVVETLSRHRFPLSRYDAGYRVVCVAISKGGDSISLCVS